MYGNLEKLPPALNAGKNPGILLRLAVEDVTVNFVPPYSGPALQVYARKDDSAEMLINRILPVRKEDVKPFSDETMEQALSRRSTEVSTAIACYAYAYGITREDLEKIGAKPSFREWVEAVIALLPPNYTEIPVAHTLVYTKKNMLFAPSYVKGKGYGVYVAASADNLKIGTKHVIVPYQEQDDTTVAAPSADPW